MMADPESLGESGVQFAEKMAKDGARVCIPMITDPRGVDLACYEPLGQTEQMADLERRFIAACQTMGIMMTNTCINYQTIMPPVFGDHVAFGDTGVVIYSNSVCGPDPISRRTVCTRCRTDRPHPALRPASG